MKIRLKIASIIISASTSMAMTLNAQTTPPLPPDKVLASNQRTSVTYQDFEAELARIPQRDHYEFLLDRQRLAQLVDNILVNKTLAIEARENKLDNDARVQAEIRNQTEKVLAKYRGQQVQDSAPNIDFNGRAREIYLANPERFTNPPLYDAWHFLVGLKGRTPAQAKMRAEEIRARLIGGEPPEKLASTLSDDESARKNDGYLGVTDLQNYDARFSAAVKKLKVGEVSPVFESAFGFHIARLRAYVEPKKLTYESVKADLVHEAETQYRLSVWDNHLRRLRNDPKLFVDAAALDAIRPKLPPLTSPVPAAGGQTK